MTQVDPCMTQVDPSWAKFSPFEAKIGPWEVFGEADPACSWNFFTFPTAIRFDSFLTFSDFKHPTLMKLCHKMQCVWPKWTLCLAVKFCSNYVDIQFYWYTNTQRNFLTSLLSILHNLWVCQFIYYGSHRADRIWASSWCLQGQKCLLWWPRWTFWGPRISC